MRTAKQRRIHELEEVVRKLEQRITTYQQRIARGFEITGRPNASYKMGWEDALRYASKAISPPPVNASTHARQVSVTHRSDREEKSE